MTKFLIYFLTFILLLNLVSALQGSSTGVSDATFALGYITFNITDSNAKVYSFGDFISSLISLPTITGWLSQIRFSQPPYPITTFSPINDSYFNYTFITFSWTNTSDPEGFAVSYLFEIWNNSNLNQEYHLNYSLIETPTPTLTNVDITSDGIYYWRIAANDSQSNSSFTELRTLTIDTILPTNFNLTSPANGTSSTDTSPSLTWDASTDTNFDNYTIELATLSDFSNISVTENSSTNSFNTWTTPLAAGTYYWRVKAVDKANNIQDSDNNLSFIVQYSTTQTVISGSSGTVSSGGGTKPFTLNIIAPDGITSHTQDTVKVPLLVINPSSVTLRGINLKTSCDEPAIKPNLDMAYISQLEANSQQKLTLTLNTADIPIGTYGINIFASVASPTYQNNFQIFANILEKERAGSPKTLEQIDFAKQLFNGNPECLDLSEYISEAELAAQNGDDAKALSLAENAVSSCNKLIEQKKPLNIITGQTAFNKIKSTLTNKTFILVSSQVLAFLLLIGIVIHYVKKGKHKK